MDHRQQDLDDLKQLLLKMAALAKQSVNQAMRAFADRDEDRARRVEQEDGRLDALEIELDERSIRLLSKAPLGRDLRLITVTMKASRDLERVGDEATTISRRSRQLNREPKLKDFALLPQMTHLALAMLDEALESLVLGAPDKARAIIPRDKEVDRMNKELQAELTGIMMQKPDTITRCLHLMTISKCLERIADHAANIAEEVVFLHEGRDIRHSANLAEEEN